MVCLDTSVLIPLLRHEERAMGKLRMEVASGTRISTTVINLCELYFGAYASRNQASELRKVKGLQETIGILEFHAEASRLYGELANHSDLRERPVGDFDLIVASIALSHDESLATRNTEHFLRIPGLTVVRW